MWSQIPKSDNIVTAQISLATIDTNEWDEKRYKSEKLRYYNLYKYDKSPEDYLLLDLSRYQKSIFAQFRCGILPLEIEIGRYRNIPLAQRICQICHKEVEDEIHLLLNCNAYLAPRGKLFGEACDVQKDFSQFNEFEKFAFLVSNLQKAVINI